MTVGDAAFEPEIHLSVMVQGAHVESLSVLVQGYIVTLRNVAQLLQLLKERIQLIEDDWAGRALDESTTANSVDALPHHSTRASLSWMLQNAVFALNSLPSSAAPLLVLVTDGVVDLFDAYSYDNLLMQLVRHDVQCHFLRVGGGDNAPNSSFGFVPDVDLLSFIASTTGGAVFDYAALVDACYGLASRDDVVEMTALQRACFLRTSHVHAISSPVLKLDELCCTSFDGRTLLPLRPYRMWREKVHEYRIFADVERIIEARMREGFLINKVHIKTYQRTAGTAAASVPVEPVAGSSTAASAKRSTDAAPSARDVTKILIVFLLQWKQNVWLEYVVSATTERAPAATARRPSTQGLGASFGTSKRSPHEVFADEQSYVGKWSEWYVKVNILAYSDFLRAFEDAATLASSSNNSAELLASAGSGAPLFLHEFIRNVQDVDRVLLHLMTATAAAIAPVDAGNQYSFGTSGSNSAAAVAAHSRQQAAHPVFNIIGELTPVLWHRWFYVERFELLSVVKSEACNDVFYRNDDRDVVERARSVRKGLMNASRGFLQLHHAGHPMHSVAIGMERVSDRLMAALQKWSSQRLSKDLFLRFLLPTAKDKPLLLRGKGAGTVATATGAGTTKRQQQRPSMTPQAGGMGGQPDEMTSIDGGSKASLCFVRLEIKNKTLCAVHVAFFATTAAARKQTLADLKANILAGVNDTPPSPLSTPDPNAPPPVKSVVLSQRLISRLVVTHETLLLHDGLDGRGLHDHHHHREYDWDVNSAQTVSSCCGGSELQLRSVFGSYMWHSSWRWHISSPGALVNVMRRLHEARVASGFWVLDWRMASSEDESPSTQLQSIIFGREILMEDENGHAKTSLVQYALRRVSETCLMTSIWMEPQHGSVKTQLASHVERTDRFHWGLKHAVGHDVPFDAARDAPAPAAHKEPSVTTQMEAERASMASEDVRVNWPGSTYLGENDLLQLIRGYIFKSDRHFLSCLYTFDCILHYRESLAQSAHLLAKDSAASDIVGSSWSGDRLYAATLKQLLPPFSTARLLRNAKRSTERFLMYLDHGAEQPVTEPETAPVDAPAVPKVSLANEHLYSMLERTLRGLSDCEVAWTDCNGNAISSHTTGQSAWDDSDQLVQDGMSGQMPLWLKDTISSAFPDNGATHSLSKGKCFAKLVGDDTVVLAFLPSLETLQVRQKTAAKLKRRATTASAQSVESPSWLRSDQKAAIRESPPAVPKPAIEPSASSRIMRMSVSADDIVLYQERRLSFREGYKSWRMGHYQGARDDKQSSGEDFRVLPTASTPEDQAFCEAISRETDYGCDFHVLIERETGMLGSGFFQVAFYECSVTRLSTDKTECQRSARMDLPQMILQRLFFASSAASSSSSNKAKDETAATPAGRDDRRLSLVPLPGGLPSPISPSPTAVPVLSANSMASRRFQKKVKRAHEHNFSRGVYIALREGSNVQQSDLLQALTSCMEIPMDLDITLLYRMMQAAAPKRAFQSLVRGNQRAVLKQKLDKAFESILSSAFVPIPGTKYFYFTGSEVAAFEELGENESELHVLMDDSDEVSSSPVPEEDARLSIDDDAAAAAAQEAQVALDASAPSKVYSPHSKPPLPKASPRASAAEAGKPARRFKDHGRPPPVKTSPSSSAEVPLIEQHAGVEEDAEFNKEVAVATSIFSAPFFFRFECREISTPRAQGKAARGSDSPATVSRDSIQRSASTQSFGAMQKDWIAKTEASSRQTADAAAHDQFASRFDTLLSSKPSPDEGVAHVAEWFGKAPASRIALRLITLTLPNEQLVDSSRHVVGAHQPHMPFEMDDSSTHGGSSQQHALGSSVSSRAQVISTLPLFQRQALQRVRKDIKEWCSVEVLDILRAANKITPAISQLVQRLFGDLPAHSRTTATYPLAFVASSQEALGNPIELFKKELARGSSLHVHELNGVYFVIEPTPRDTSVLVSGDAVVAAEDAASSFAIPYWAFFTVESDHVTLQLHHPDRFAPAQPSSSPPFDRLSVLTRLHLGVMDACKRVNQYLLLLQLHETRSCSDVLLPAPPNQVASPRSPRRRDSGSNLVGLGASPEHFFWPGQFECDLQYSAFFKLHERLSPNMALNMLCTSALEQFQVHNRRHVFVYRDRGGHVFYMKISIKHEFASGGSGEASADSSRRRITRIGSGVAPSSSAPSSTSSTSASSMSASGSVVGILLEVFGVCPAGEEVTQELCRVLERKLDEATQLILMKLLARNAKFQLSASDMAFVCPPGGKPAQVVEFVLPTKLRDATSLLQFVSQTLSAAPFVRNMSSSGSRATGDATATELALMRTGRRQSTHGALAVKPELDEPIKVHDPAFVHPSLFFVVDAAPALPPSDVGALNASSSSSEVVSPVFLSASPPTVKPKVVDHASFVLNLNPELRLSPGFLSRIGKGLAVFHIELVHDYSIEANSGDATVVRKSLEHFDDASETRRQQEDSVPRTGLHVVVCQLWIRGSINTSELAALLESNVREAMLDYQIEATLKTLAATARACAEQQPDEKPAPATLPREVSYLTSLFEKSWRLSSASVTKMALRAPIAPWDLSHVVQQLQAFLRCVPSHLRPAMYSKTHVADAFTMHDASADVSDAQASRQFIRLVARLETRTVDASSDSDSAASIAHHVYHHHHHHSARGLHLNHSDSIQSDLSELETISNKQLSLTWTSMTGSESNLSSGFHHASTASSASASGALPVAHFAKEFSENELLLYPNSSHASPSAPASSASVSSDVASAIESEAAAPPVASATTTSSPSSRSFYYVIDISCADGLQVFGYNMSSAVVDTILVQFARILTWSKLRESLVRSLLFEKSGLARAAPLGLAVVHPRDLYVSGGGSAVGKTSFVLPKDFCVNFVEFWKPAMVILTGNATLPRLLDSALLRLIEGSSLGKYLREAHTLASDRSDLHRPRAVSNASLQASTSAQPELHRDASSQSSSRSLRSVEISGPPNALVGMARGNSATGMKIDRTVPSPTKRGMSGGGPAGAFKPSTNNAPAAANPRMRGNVGAANALLAARARARGALPGRMGGPGASSKPASSGDSVAPWDLPLTNTKGPVLTGSGAPDTASTTSSDSTAAAPKPQLALSTSSSTETGARRAGVKAPSTSHRDLASPVSSPVGGFSSGFGSGHSRQNSLTSNDAASLSFSWRKQLELAWSPRFKYHDHAATRSAERQSSATQALASSATSDRRMRVNPLLHFSDAFQTRLQMYEDRSTSHTICLNLFDKLVSMKAGDDMDEPVSLAIVERLVESGHQLLHQRFRVTFVERWEVVKVDDEYVDEDMQDGRLRALQASMDLVNLLSYKKEFVFAGNECTIANFYTEHTVVGMCANEGDAVRDMKKQIMRNIFHLRMGVAHAFYDEYAVHLRALGFRRLATLSNASSSSAVLPGVAGPGPLAPSASSSSLSAANMFGSESDGFSEYFYFPGTAHGKLKGWQANASGAAQCPPTLLLLELKCDHHGVQLGVVLVNQRDLVQHAMGFQSRLARSNAVRARTGSQHVVSGEMVACISTWLRDALRTRAIIYGFTIRFFQQYLTKWSNDQHEREQQRTGAARGFGDDTEAVAATLASSGTSTSSRTGHDVQSFQNIVKGVRCFLHVYPEPPPVTSSVTTPAAAIGSSPGADRGLRGGRSTLQQPRDSVLRTAVVELPPTQLHSNCSEAILVKILLRYIACHGARYEVLDLMQFGTPDAVVCHSPSGSFFHRPATASGPTPFGFLPPRTHFTGYSLLITTQSLVEGFGLQAHDKKRRKHCIQLILLKSAASTASLGVGNTVLPVERALLEAEYFVQELFRVAAQHYERDLLWSRLLYDDTTGPGAKVAATLALPPNHFQVDVGPQQLEECLRLSVCTPLEEIDPTLAQLLDVDGVCWQEFALRLRDVYADQLREYQFEEEAACHFLLLCPNTHDLIIHLTFESGVAEEPLLDFSTTSNSNASGRSGVDDGDGDGGKVKIEICRREEPLNRKFTFAQRRVITDFVNSIVHWQWRSLLYD